MSARSSKDVKLVLGASPRVDLLPPEVADRKRGAAVRRSVVFGVVGAIVLVAGAYAFASWQAIDASIKYDAAQAETAALLAKQNEFATARTATNQLATIADAQRVGAMTEISWDAFYDRVAATLPAGLTINSFSVDSSSPTVAVVPTTVPGRVAQVANATFVASATDPALAQTWVVNMKALPEYGGAFASSITREEGVFSVTVSMFITEAAYTNRFAPVATPEAVAEESETE